MKNKNSTEYQERQMNRQEKSTSLGMLSAGIVHEIQNPLNFIVNSSKLSHQSVKALEEFISEVHDLLPDDFREEMHALLSDLGNNIARIAENGDRISDIIRGILRYSRGKDDYVPTDLKELVHEYIWLSYHAVRSENKNFNASIRENYEDDIPLLNLIPQAISRAVLNLMNNACDAVFDKANLTSDATYSPTIVVSIKKVPNAISLVIEDNGTGIPGEVGEKLYMPFFTTKLLGEGTGLGLSITKSILEGKHNGTIRMETKPDEFTRFTVSFPMPE
ncbi:MAG: two-component sensor histidine kinase [Tannerellaceae bacterium]|jgi:signal transduction histidine kinase|nr:two-component sensor histidine kinase [Tannerellaceae bacterium]